MGWPAGIVESRERKRTWPNTWRSANPASGGNVEAEILGSEEIGDSGGEATYRVLRYDGLEFAAIEYGDGTVFTQPDWQGSVEEPPEELPRAFAGTVVTGSGEWAKCIDCTAR